MVVAVRKRTFYTKIFGCYIHKRMEYSSKTRVGDSNGVLFEDKGGEFYVAFSRDQPQKVYVQHKTREQSRRIWSLLNQGAAIYISGSANKMPSNVLSAFQDIVSKEAGVPKEAALK